MPRQHGVRGQRMCLSYAVQRACAAEAVVIHLATSRGPPRCVWLEPMDIDSVIEELYSAPRDDFVAKRTELAAEARRAGDRALADDIKSLRKPTTSAWLLNRLAREHPREIERLDDLGAKLRDAHTALAGEELRKLSRKRHELIRALLDKTRALAGKGSNAVSDSVATEVEATLSAAFSDPDLADEVRAGRLTTAHTGGSDQWLTAALAASTATPRTKAPSKETHSKQTPSKEPPRRPEPSRKEPPSRKQTGPSAAERERAARDRAERERARQAAAAADRARKDAEREVFKAERAAERATASAEDLRSRLSDAERREREAQRELRQAQKLLDAAAKEADKTQRRLDTLNS